MLAKLHQVDFAAVGLGDYGRPGNYFERQIARFARQYRDAETETIADMDALIEALPARIPDEASVSIAHGDYRLENVMFHPTEPRLIAVLDWELSTIGHPLADLAYNSFLWRSMSPGWGSLRARGLSRRAAFRRKPTTRGCPPTAVGPAAREVDDWSFYMAHFDLPAWPSISQGVYRRVLAGIVASERPAENGARALAAQARAILDGG